MKIYHGFGWKNYFLYLGSLAGAVCWGFALMVMGASSPVAWGIVVAWVLALSFMQTPMMNVDERYSILRVLMFLIGLFGIGATFGVVGPIVAVIFLAIFIFEFVKGVGK